MERKNWSSARGFGFESRILDSVKSRTECHCEPRRGEAICSLSNPACGLLGGLMGKRARAILDHGWEKLEALYVG